MRLDAKHRWLGEMTNNQAEYHALIEGIKAIKGWKPDRVEIYPRLCPHEGACLDALHAPGQPAIQCPWHGRSFQPIVTLAYTQTPTTVLGPLHRFVLTASQLRIEPLGYADRTTPADWTRWRPPTADLGVVSS